MFGHNQAWVMQYLKKEMTLERQQLQLDFGIIILIYEGFLKLQWP